MAHRRDHDFVDEQADHNGRRAQENVVDESHHARETIVAAVFGHVSAGQDPDGRADRQDSQRLLRL